MRILLDENLDWRLGRGLLGHEVEPVQRLGWAGIQNGVLLKKAEETGFEVLITMDSNNTFQLISQATDSRLSYCEHAATVLQIRSR